MDTRSRVRALRTIVSALLGSELTHAQLSATAQLLTDDSTFVREIAELLDASGHTLRRHKNRRLSNGKDDPWIREVKNLIKSKRLSKRRILDWLADAGVNVFGAKDPAMSDVFEILNASSDSTKAKLLDWLRGGERGGDPYLEGIMKRP